MNKFNEFIGIDVSKDSLDFYAQKQGHLKVTNTISGYKKAVKLFGTEGFYVMEATGSYYQRLALFLFDNGLKVCVVNPLSVKRFIQMKLCRNKTDKSDAKMISLYGKSESPKLWQPRAEYVEQCQILQGVINKYLRDRTSLKNKLHSLTSKGVCKGAVIQSLKRSIKHLTKEIEKLDSEIEKLLKKNEPELLTNLQSIPGIGSKTAQVLISGTSGFKSFEHSAQVIKYIGLAPMEHSSGSSVRKQARINKTGNSQIRNHLFLCAFTASKVNPQCRALYDRLVAKRKSKKLALIAVCNKLLKQAFAIAKSGIPYDPNFKSINPLKFK